MTDRMVLAGIKALDFGMGGASPLAMAILSDFGAEVIKVEPLRGDWSRGSGLGTREFNRNKRNISVDLKHPKGIELIKRMVKDVDVLLEGFRPGVMSRLGLGYEAVKELNPRIIYCSISGYGQTGPWKDKPGVDGIVQASSGIMSVVGHEDDERGPIKVSFPVVDMTGGIMAAQGILLALIAREKYGIGQHIDVSLLETALVIQKSTITRYLASRELPIKTGSGAPYTTPNEAYKTKDGYIMLAAYAPKRWKTLCCQVLGRPELENDPRFDSRVTKMANRKELKAIIESVLKDRTTEEWYKIFQELDLLSSPIYNYEELLGSEHIKERKALETLTFPDGSTMETVAVVPRLSATPGKIRSPYPKFIGQHTKEILLSLGMTEEEITELEAEEVIKCHK